MVYLLFQESLGDNITKILHKNTLVEFGRIVALQTIPKKSLQESNM